MRDLDPARWRRAWQASMAERLTRLQAALGRLLALAWPEDGFSARIHAQLSSLAQAFLGQVPVDRAGWMALRARLQPHYEAFARELQAWDIHVPQLRPTNLARNAFHLAWALACLVLLHELFSRETLAFMATTAALGGWSMEFSRRRSTRVNAFLMWVFGPFAHPHEAWRINSSTWYTTAVALLSWACPTAAGTVALAVLGTGDPCAALVGRRFGKHSLVNGRTVEGTAAFLTASTLAGWAALSLWMPEIGPWRSLAGAAAGATAGAMAELWVRRIDDNLAIPLAAAAAASLVLGGA